MRPTSQPTSFLQLLQTHCFNVYLPLSTSFPAIDRLQSASTSLCIQGVLLLLVARNRFLFGFHFPFLQLRSRWIRCLRVIRQLPKDILHKVTLSRRTRQQVTLNKHTRNKGTTNKPHPSWDRHQLTTTRSLRSKKAGFSKDA